MRGMMGGTIVFALAFAFYLFLAGTIATIELIAAFACAAATTAIATGLATVALRRFRFLPPFKAVWRPIAALLPETVVVGRELVRVALHGADRQVGDFVRQPFVPGGDDPTEHGRRALTVLGVSLAPRTFVIRGERDDVLLLHAFPTRPPSPDANWPA